MSGSIIVLQLSGLTPVDERRKQWEKYLVAQCAIFYHLLALIITYCILAQAQNEQFAAVFNLEDYKGNFSSVFPHMATVAACCIQYYNESKSYSRLFRLLILIYHMPAKLYSYCFSYPCDVLQLLSFLTTYFLKFVCPVVGS